jgi:glycosyltransferase involved in cell wall biosynthesis
VNLLLVTHEYPPVGAGAATGSSAIAHNLTTLGHDVTVMTAHRKGLPRCESEGKVIVERIRCVRKRSDRSGLFEMLTFLMMALVRLPFVLAKYRPDGLLIFFSLPSGPLGLVAKFFYRLPYVISLRGGDVPGLVPELDWMHKVVAPLRRLVLKHAHAIIANAEGLRKLSEAADPFVVRVIENGVDVDLFVPAQTSRQRHAGVLRILFVGRFQAQKNLPLLLEQVAHLPTGTFELHLVGDGPERPRLQRLAEKLGIAAAVTWHGWVTRAVLPQMYQAADCLVNPSKYEGMPNVVLEAMACGLPVIASNVPGNKDLVTNGQTGFLFELNDVAALASALNQLREVDLRLRLGEDARGRATQLFSWQTAAAQYAMLFCSPENEHAN